MSELRNKLGILMIHIIPDIDTNVSLTALKAYYSHEHV